MRRTKLACFCFVLLCSAWNVHAEPAIRTAGALIVVPAYGEVRQANDEARLTFMVEEYDRDKMVAASRVNKKMRDGAEIIKRADSAAMLKTRGYYTYPVYPDDQPSPRQNKAKLPAGWRVGQYLEMTTTNLDVLPETVAEAQRILALNGLQFGLTETATRKLDEKRIDATYRNLVERIAAIAKAMGHSASDAILDTVDFESSEVHEQQDFTAPVMAARTVATSESPPLVEPSFEPGETVLHMRAIGKFRFR
jgi:uncharacterized protein YggE